MVEEGLEDCGYFVEYDADDDTGWYDLFGDEMELYALSQPSSGGQHQWRTEPELPGPKATWSLKSSPTYGGAGWVSWEPPPAAAAAAVEQPVATADPTTRDDNDVTEDGSADEARSSSEGDNDDVEDEDEESDQERPPMAGGEAEVTEPALAADETRAALQPPAPSPVVEELSVAQQPQAEQTAVPAPAAAPGSAPAQVQRSAEAQQQRPRSQEYSKIIDPSLYAQPAAGACGASPTVNDADAAQSLQAMNADSRTTSPPREKPPLVLGGCKLARGMWRYHKGEESWSLVPIGPPGRRDLDAGRRVTRQELLSHPQGHDLLLQWEKKTAEALPVALPPSDGSEYEQASRLLLLVEVEVPSNHVGSEWTSKRNAFLKETAHLESHLASLESFSKAQLLAHELDYFASYLLPAAFKGNSNLDQWRGRCAAFRREQTSALPERPQKRRRGAVAEAGPWTGNSEWHALLQELCDKLVVPAQ